MDVEPSVAVVEESSPDAVADPVKEEQAPTTPVPPVTVVQVGQVSSRDGCLPSLGRHSCAEPLEPLCHEYFGLRPR